MDLYNGLVTEVLMSEVGTKGWKEFEAKYTPLAHRPDLFVQFTNFAGDTDDKRLVGQAIDKGKAPEMSGFYAAKGKFSKEVQKKIARITPDVTLFTKPDHKDPTAIYTYPLEYVINHPTSIPYGASARFLRVIKLRPGTKALDLQKVTKESGIALLKQMGKRTMFVPGLENVEDDTEWFEKLWRMGVDSGEMRFHPHPVTAPKVFFMIAQAGTYIRPKWSDDKGDFPAANNNAQRRWFLKAGIQMVFDTAHDKSQAVIHPNEPEQAFFMSRGGFDVVDAFEVGKKHNPKISNTQAIYDPHRAWRKVMGKAVETIDPKDQIIGVKQAYGGIHGLSGQFPTSGEEITLDSEWVGITKRGRAVSVRFDHEINRSPAFFERPIHRSGDKHIPFVYYVGVKDETGTYETKIEAGESLAQGLSRIRAQHQQRPTDKEWRPMRGFDSKSEAWIGMLTSLPNPLKPKYVINLDATLNEAPQITDGLAKLMAEVGWKWEPPTDKWECIACWIAANHLYKLMLSTGRGNGGYYSYESGMERLKGTVYTMVNGRSGFSPLPKGDKHVLKGTPVEKQSDAIMAGYMDDPDLLKDRKFLVDMIHGMEMVFQKRWLIISDPAYPNFRDDISKHLTELIEDCEKETYAKRLAAKWLMLQQYPDTGSFKKAFYNRTGEHAETWGLKVDPRQAKYIEDVSEVIIGTKFSIDTPNSVGQGGAMPTVWKDPSKELSFSAPAKKGTPNPVMAKAKATVEKIIKRHLTWIRDPSTGSETAYIGHGRKVRIGLRDLKAGPLVIPIRADRLPANLAQMLAY
jgi:hypothetical protein